MARVYIGVTSFLKNNVLLSVLSKLASINFNPIITPFVKCREFQGEDEINSRRASPHPPK